MAKQLVEIGISAATAVAGAYALMMYSIQGVGAGSLDGVSTQFAIVGVDHLLNLRIGNKKNIDDIAAVFQGDARIVFDFGASFLDFLRNAQDTHFSSVDWTGPNGTQIAILVEMGRDFGNTLGRFTANSIAVAEAVTHDLIGRP